MTEDYIVAIIAGIFTIIGAVIGFLLNVRLEKLKSELQIKNDKIKFGLTSKINTYHEFSKTMRDIQTLNNSICNSKSHEEMKILVDDRNKLFTQLTAINKSPYMTDEIIHDFYFKMNEYIAAINVGMMMHFNSKQQISNFSINANIAANKAGELCNLVDDHIQKVISKELGLN